MNGSLDDRDYDRWLQETASTFVESRFFELDTPNLIDEIWL